MPSATKVEFVQTPLTVLEADMPPMHKVGFQFLLYRCWRDHCDFIHGSYRALAKQLHIAKTSFITRVLPAWIKAGWITVQEIGKEVIITLCKEAITVPPRDTLPPTPTETNGPNRDVSVPLLDIAVPPRDKSVPLVSSKQTVIVSNSTDILLTLSKEISSNVSSLTVPPRDTEEGIPELTPELVLQLSSEVLPVPSRPAGGPELERWMKAWYTPAKDLIADYAPVTGPLAWREMDEVNRFTSSPESGWMKKIGRLPTLENIRNTLHIQREQMARLGGWQPEQRTPYPGVPSWDDQQVPQEDAQLLLSEELDALVAAILTPDPIQTVPLLDTTQAPRMAQPFATEQELLDYADLLLRYNPGLQLVITTPPDGGFVLLAQCDTGDCYVGLDPNIWEYPTPDEEALICCAIRYGQASQVGQPEAVTV